MKKNKHHDLLKIVLEESAYSNMLKNKKDIENESRHENIKELLIEMNDYEFNIISIFMLYIQWFIVILYEFTNFYKIFTITS